MQASSGGSADPRLDERSNVFLSATLESASGTVPVRIRNISRMGAMLDGAGLPDEGAPIKLRRGDLVIGAEVVWQSGVFRGVRFERAISVDDWVGRVGHSGQQTVDKLLAAMRAGKAMAATGLGESADEKSLAELSEELLQVCERLASLPDLTVQIAEEVLRVESIALSLRRLASES